MKNCAPLFRWRKILTAFAALAFLQGAMSCGGGGGGSDQSYQGTITSSTGVVGTLQLNIDTDRTSNNVNGSVDPNGDNNTVDVSGSFNSAGVLSVSGGGYNLMGAAVNGIMTGTLTGPSSSTGGFTALNSNNSVTEYCGVFSGSQSGVWSMEISSNDDAAASASVLNGSNTLVYTGSLSGGDLSLTSVGGGTATGTLSGSTVQGNWSDGNGDSGTFSASSDGC